MTSAAQSLKIFEARLFNFHLISGKKLNFPKRYINADFLWNTDELLYLFWLTHFHVTSMYLSFKTQNS